MRIYLLVAALNDLYIQSVGIENAYLTDPCRENIRTRACPKFEKDEVKVFIIVMALYGLKSSGAALK